MAGRNGSLTGGFVALGFLAVVAGGAAAGLVMAALADPAGEILDRRLWRVTAFTLTQAGLSAVLSAGLAVPLALALNRRTRFPGRSMLLRLFALPLALPAIAAALAILALYGANGWLAVGFARVGYTAWPGIYGLGGILLAHVFFNLPLVARLLLAALAATPANHYRLAAGLGMDERAILRWVEWPALRAALPGAALLVFALCLASFTIVLLLGGGPASTTLEVEIYQALRYDFDPGRAGVLVAAQLALAAVAALALGSAEYRRDASLSVGGRPQRVTTAGSKFADAAVIVVAALFVGAPLAAFAGAGFDADFTRLLGERPLWRALATSLVVATLAGLAASALALGLAGARKTFAGGGFGLLLARAPYLTLALPATALGAGWFLLFNRFTDPSSFAILIVVAINAAMALPFAYGAVRPAHDAGRDLHDRLCASLGVSGWSRWRRIDWPFLRGPLASAFAFAAALSFGDLGAIALFGSDAVQTLPWLALARMGSYRTADADGIALILGLACVALVAASDRLAAGARS
jgi:thiamine transport system permease protein